MKTLSRVFLSATVLMQSLLPAHAIDGRDGQFYYRPKDNRPVITVPETEEKDIVAYFVGGVDYAFEEVLPLKPEWQDDNWSLLPGSVLPAGITFDSQTLTFKGIPTTPGSDTVVFLRGIDSNGNSVAEAKVSFDIRTIRGVPVKLDIYAHTDKYKLAELSIPEGITVDSWERVNIGPLPPGITASGPYLEGTPTEAGQWRYMAVGLNYMKQPVVTFFGNYIVEDRPSFPFIPDNVQKLPQVDQFYRLRFHFGAPSSYAVNHVIDPTKAVRYSLEYKTPGSGLPGSVSNVATGPAVELKGDVWDPYDTAEVRFKAVDSDGVEGWSNWFTFGSSDPQPSCNPWHNASAPLQFVTGRENNVTVPRPYGNQGTTSYTLASGTLPTGIILVTETGILTGTPTTSGETTQFEVRIDVANAGGTVSTSCFYSATVSAQTARIIDATDLQAMHVRTGDVYSGVVSLAGGIPTYTLGFEDSAYPEIAFTSPTVDRDTVTLSGPIRTDGTHTVKLKLTNGDGNTKPGSVKVTAHGELNVNDLAEVRVKRLASSTTWASVPYDASTVIDDMKSGGFPKFKLDVPGQLPQDIVMGSDGSFKGATSVNAGRHGPFVATMSDYSGDTDTTAPFYVVVEDRDPIQIAAPTDTTFTVQRSSEQKAARPVVVQPPLAKNFKVSYALDNLSGVALPSWLSFDTDTGVIVAAADIPYEDIDTYGPYSITATDTEGSAATTPKFNVSVTDWPKPFASLMATVKGTVSGDTSSGENATWINITDIRDHIDENSVIGGKAKVVFGTPDPASPAGLIWDPQTASFSGHPTSEFNGNVKIGFEDVKGRSGTVEFALEVRRYPVAQTSKTEYEIARLSQAETAAEPIKGTEAGGFWTAPVWTVDTTKGPALPTGLTLNKATGAVSGKPTDTAGTVVRGIVFKATSKAGSGETVESWTAPFSITISARKPIGLSYKPAQATYYLNEVNRALGIYTLNTTLQAFPTPVGSYVGPLEYKIDRSQANANGMTGNLDVNKTTGAFIGFPDRPGEWAVAVDMKDAEGQRIVEPAAVGIKATLEGFVKRSNGEGSFLLRQDEPFKTDALQISNYVGTATFSALPATLQSSALNGFDPLTGEFTDESYFSSFVYDYIVSVNVKDSHGRTFGNNPVNYRFTALPPLEISASPQSAPAKQYETSKPVNVVFSPTLKYVMGKIVYGVNGDLPGTLVNRVYNDEGALKQYAWTDDTSQHVVQIDQTGSVSGYTVDGSNQPLVSVNGSNAPAEAYFPFDALVFDTLAATLKGTPSKAGAFELSVTAYDSHSEGYIRPVATQAKFNRATSDPVTVTVDAAEPLIIANSAAAETLVRYTTQPTLSHSVTGGAFGQPVSWSAVSGELPEGIQAVKTGNLVSYKGYSEVQGTFGNIVWRATDAAGRRVSTDPVTITVGPEQALAVTNSASTETIPQYTGQPAITHTVTGAPYGRGVTWTAVSGALPSNVTAEKGSTVLSYAGYPDTRGVSPGIVWRATDARGRMIDTPAISMTVGPRLPLELVADFHPPIYVLDATISDNKVTAKNFADGKTIPASDWTVATVSGLPGGITSSIEDGRVVFSGTPTETGNWSVTVTATDSRGATASQQMPFRVIPTDDEIRLTVADITTKVGYPYSMQSSASNTYGKVRYYSKDISGELASQLSISPSTGLVTGSFTSTGDRDFDVFVTDETNRVTSKPVLVKVLPDVRVTVPSIVQATQAAVMDRAVSTAYVLGSVTYVKGAGDWPVGVEVDPANGRLFSRYVDPINGAVTTKVIAASGSYPGLTIRATDTFVIGGVTYTDVEESNSFTITVEAADLVPDISDPSKTILGTAAAAIAGWSPTVVDTTDKKPWVWAGTVYTASHDLTQYGLSFDRDTGRISGTATEGFIIRDFRVTVTSQRGRSDTTKPFWIGIAPKDPLAVAATQKAAYKFRLFAPMATDPLAMTNYVGNLTFTKVTNTQLLFNTANGVWSHSGVGQTESAWLGTFSYVSRITDEFNRTVDTTVSSTWVKALVVGDKSATYTAGELVTVTPATVTNLTGAAVYSSTDLPAYLSLNPTTGVVSGTVPANVTGDIKFKVKVTDSGDGSSVISNVILSGGYIYWRLYDNQTTGNYNMDYWGCTADGIDLFDQDGTLVNNLKVNGSYPTTYAGYGAPEQMIFEVSAYGDGCHVARQPGTNSWWKTWKFSKPIGMVSKITWRYNHNWDATSSSIMYPQVWASNDNVNWTLMWRANVPSRTMTVTIVQP